VLEITYNITKKGRSVMYSHREIITSESGSCVGKRISIVIVLLFVLVPLSGSMTKMEANEIEQSKEVIRSLIEVLRSIRYDYSGMGTARITVGPTGDMFGDKRKERMIQFKFKDNLSRSDYYYINEEQEKDFVCTWSVNRKGALAYTGGLLTLRKKPYAQFDRSFGFDFHPETFARLCSYHIDPATLLERVLTNADKITTNMDDKGILHISVFWERANGGVKFAFDTTKAYKVVSWEIDKDIGVARRKRRKGSYKAELANYGEAGWYIKNALYELGSKTIKVEVTDFRFNPDIPDSEFTADGLNIPLGTDVFDQILGINYRYGEPVIAEAELEDALKKTEFYREHVEEAREGVHLTGGDDSNEIRLVLDKETKEPETNWSSTYVLIVLVFAIISTVIMIKLKFRRGKR